MIFKAHRIKDFDNIQKNRLYQINHDNKISFVEQQEDGSKDTVDIFYAIKENQQGLYANEYKPSDIGDCKVVDIFAMIYNKEPETQGKYLLYMFDVKDTVGGKDVIFKLVEQWKDGLLHKQSLVQYLRGYAGEEHIGVITREFDKNRIKREIDTLKAENTECDKITIPLMQAKMKYYQLNNTKNIEVLENFLNGIFYDGKDKIEYEVCLMDKKGENNYYTELRISME